MSTLSLIVPCYNEQDVLPMFYDEVTKVLLPLSHVFSTELVFVDDGSKDKTLEIIKELSQRDTSVKYISFSRNFGKEAAMLAGMTYAVKSDYIGILDADLQHSPDIIPEMLRYITEEGYDVAAAKRSDRDGENAFTSKLSQLFYKFANKLCEIEINDSAQDFRIMKRDVVKAVLAMSENIRFSKGIFTWVGFNVKWIEHKNRERAAGKTKWSIKKLFKYALDGILGYTDAPLKLSFLFSTAFLLFSLISLITGIVKQLSLNNYTATIPFVLAGLFIAAAVVLFCIGIAGEYISRIYSEVKNRPKYIISQTNTRIDF